MYFRCSTKVIAVQLLDINDNPPIFNLSVVNLHLSEDLKVGSLLTKINARDMDSLNSPILFLNEVRTNLKFERLKFNMRTKGVVAVIIFFPVSIDPVKKAAKFRS